MTELTTPSSLSADPVFARRPLELWWIVAALGLGVRIVVAYATRGTQDIIKWQQFAEQIGEHGVRYMYEHVSDYNHPPLMGKLAQFSLALSNWTRLPFHFVFKVPAIAADGLSAYLVWLAWSARKARARNAALLFAFSLTSILVSAFHGNTDSIVACLCLLSGYLFDHHRRHFLAGLALGAAINVKLIPVFCIPALLIAAPTWRSRGLVTLGLAVGAVPFLPYLLTCASAFYRNTLAYNSNFDNWGTAFLISSSAGNPRLAAFAQSVSVFWQANARYVIVIGVLALCAQARLSRLGQLRATPLVTQALAMFLFLTPGFGVQYTVYVVPGLFAVNAKIATAYSVAAGLFIGVVYWTFLRPGTPYYSNFDTAFPMPAPLIGLLAWSILGYYVFKASRFV